VRVTPVIEPTPVTEAVRVTPAEERSADASRFDTAQTQAQFAQAAGGFADEQFVPHGEQTESDVIADLRARAESGDGDAAVRLGKMYLDGDGAQKDAAQAVRLFTLGMSEGNADALYHLALCCLNGEGTDFDLNRGLQLMREAAEQGSGMAMQFMQEADK
ncbi:MAG: sel1 repeat family protein, partial [Clostridiales bacterium]|nr:sel1 repeat family protein [Clostridiales bacterium]